MNRRFWKRVEGTREQQRAMKLAALVTRILYLRSLGIRLNLAAK